VVVLALFFAAAFFAAPEGFVGFGFVCNICFLAQAALHFLLQEINSFFPILVYVSMLLKRNFFFDETQLRAKGRKNNNGTSEKNKKETRETKGTDTGRSIKILWRRVACSRDENIHLPQDTSGMDQTLQPSKELLLPRTTGRLPGEETTSEPIEAEIHVRDVPLQETRKAQQEAQEPAPDKAWIESGRSGSSASQG
jgi:hypothetical protein